LGFPLNIRVRRTPERSTNGAIHIYHVTLFGNYSFRHNCWKSIAILITIPGNDYNVNYKCWRSITI